MSNRIAIAARDIYASYADAPVLRNVSMEVREGEVLGVVGPNGAGKSTLLKVAGGLHRAASGRVEIFGRALESYDRAALARALAMSGQEIPPAFGFTALEIVLMGRAPHLGALEFESPRDLEIARAAMERLDVGAMARRGVLELSGGERKRVFLARVIAQDAPIMMLDEPTAFLDFKHVDQVMRLFRSLARERGAAIVATLHDLNAAAAYADRVMIIHDGECAAVGAPREVLTAETLSRVYDADIYVGANPHTGALMIAPAARPQ